VFGTRQQRIPQRQVRRRSDVRQGSACSQKRDDRQRRPIQQFRRDESRSRHAPYATGVAPKPMECQGDKNADQCNVGGALNEWRPVRGNEGECGVRKPERIGERACQDTTPDHSHMELSGRAIVTEQELAAYSMAGGSIVYRGGVMLSDLGCR
jgi:hypothetical protein